MLSKSRLAIPVLLAAAVACDDSAPTSPARPAPLPPLQAALWHVHEAEGQTLPALVAHRLEDGNLVQDFLDSARVQVNAGGTWVRSMWISRFRSGRYEAPVTSQELGSWAVTDSGYLFTAEPSGRAFILSRAVPGDSITIPLRTVADGGFIQAKLRSTPPAVSLYGEFVVTEVRGKPVPATIYDFPEFVDGDRTVSIHLVVDSARLRLLPNGGYEHSIYYSEWEGPVGGGPTTIRYRFQNHDFGTFSRSNTLISFNSGWIENQNFAGTVYNANVMELLHGLTSEDPPVPIRYARP